MAKRRAAKDRYESPLVTRNASPEMLELWSPRRKFSTWRRIWIALAEAQRECGLKISDKQIRDMKRVADDIDFAAAERYEAQTRHDVMAHIHTFGDAAPSARGVIHLGATSMDVVDNCDLILMRDALDILIARLAAAASALADFCERYADLPALGFTHLQPAQLTTVGKRASLWLQDFIMDLERLVALHDGLRCRGLRGATGTQASFLALLGNARKVAQLEKSFASRLGFARCYPVAGQTYTRKVDIEVISSLASFAAGAHKCCNDIRLLASLREMEEPFGRKQVGSSAMAYKRNPAMCERATGLARFLMSLSTSPPMTAAAQMFERTLDDSSNKRLVIPEAFLTADGIAILLHNILSGLVVYPEMIGARVRAELPFIATEDILMAATRKGGDRQQLHEKIRGHSIAAAEQIKLHGRPNDLLDRMKSDPAFADLDWENVLDPRRYVGLAPQQVRAFLKRDVRPLLGRLGAGKAGEVELKV
jgi:adenylosuccinate lyase